LSLWWISSSHLKLIVFMGGASLIFRCITYIINSFFLKILQQQF